MDGVSGDSVCSVNENSMGQPNKLCQSKGVRVVVVFVNYHILYPRLLTNYEQYTSVSENVAVASDGNFPISELLACLAFIAGKVFILSCNVINIGKWTNTLSILILITSEVLLCLYWTVKSKHYVVLAIIRVSASQDGQWLLTWLPRSQLACFVSALVVLLIQRQDAAYNLAGILAHVCVHFSSLVGLYSGPQAHMLLHVTVFHLILLYSSTRSDHHSG